VAKYKRRERGMRREKEITTAKRLNDSTLHTWPGTLFVF